MPRDSEELALSDANVLEAIARGFIENRDGRVFYNLKDRRDYSWANPEEWVRARTIAFLIVHCGYPANRIRTEVQVPRRTPTDFADAVVYEDDRCTAPYLVAENKASGQTATQRSQAVEQLFGNANSLRAKFGLYDEYTESAFFDVAGYPAGERSQNRMGDRSVVQKNYGQAPIFAYTAGTANDIRGASTNALESKIRRSHSIIWAGGKRDPLLAFDEWSKLLFAKVVDERTTPTHQPRRFQVGSAETTATVANRVHQLFLLGCRDDPTIFPPGTRINLPDKKIFDVVMTLQPISLIATEVDSIGTAFENFFGSVFRGELGQYFTMRPLARFAVSMLDVAHTDFVIDPTAGSGGFLLEALLQVWHRIDREYAGQRSENVLRIKEDFALQRVYGIEIHDILSRICKINLLLHHDGHTNIEGDRSCLDSTFSKPRLQNWSGRFTRVLGNPPFGDEVRQGDDDLLGTNSLSNFIVAQGRDNVPSEHVIIERSVDFLEPGGRFGLVVPDGLLNNQGELSNCPRMRSFLARKGLIEAIVSLPDYAFRKSGAQNKTSILFFRKFTSQQQIEFDNLLAEALDVQRSLRPDAPVDYEEGIRTVYQQGPFSSAKVFLAEANKIGYLPTGLPSRENELYQGQYDGHLAAAQTDSILGEWHRFLSDQNCYNGRESPDCIALRFADAWLAHASHRLDPKYHLFKRNETAHVPEGWVKERAGAVLRRRLVEADLTSNPEALFHVMTIGQNGEIREREAAKGRNPPEWLAMYLDEGPSTWHVARAGDVVFSSIDLWKGCIAVVPSQFDQSIVTKEFPIYEVIDERLDAEFLSMLLRSRYYQRAFRAITTGHSNRRRTQVADFEDLEICFPPDRPTQQALIHKIKEARKAQFNAANQLRRELLRFSDLLDGRADQELPAVDAPNDSDAN
jgi:type I restriction enzyme M protein